MQVYGAGEADAARFVQILNTHGIRAQIERYASNAVYVVVAVDGPELEQLAYSAGRTVRRVLGFEELRLRDRR